MATTALVRFFAVMTAVTVAASAACPAQATSDKRIDLAAPRWVDQTVYQPDCRNIERHCGCHFDSYGEPVCGLW